jgi:hypothetical protein
VYALIPEIAVNSGGNEVKNDPTVLFPWFFEIKRVKFFKN